MVVAGHLFVLGILTSGLSNKTATDRDFIEYWAAGQQLIHGDNPYDAAAILRLERSVGLEENQPVRVSFSPPVALFLALPLGLASPKIALTLWLAVLLVSLSISVWVLWLLNGRPDNRFHLLGYAYAPVLACLMAGQLGIFLLLGLVLFFIFQQSRPHLAGAVLLPCALKPHLFLPFAVVLLIWALSRKTYSILVGISAALLASCALSLCLDPHAWSQYSQIMRAGGALNDPVPALSVIFRFLADRNAVWLQFLPEAAACAWALWYFWTRRDRWSWMDQGLLLLLVSAMCAPYAFFTDESMLLPAVLAGLYRAAHSRRSLVPLALIGGVALTEVLAVVKITSPFYIWTTPAWLAWYLYATRSKNKRAATEPV
jgi:hypothetical protein